MAPSRPASASTTTASRQEHLRVILLDTKNHVLDIPTIYVGSVNSSLVRAAEILRPAIRANAVAIIIAQITPLVIPPHRLRMSTSRS